MVVQIIFGTLSYILLGMALVGQATYLIGFFKGMVKPSDALFHIATLILLLSLYAGAFVCNFFARK